MGVNKRPIFLFIIIFRFSIHLNQDTLMGVFLYFMRRIYDVHAKVLFFI